MCCPKILPEFIITFSAQFEDISVLVMLSQQIISISITVSKMLYKTWGRG